MSTPYSDPDCSLLNIQLAFDESSDPKAGSVSNLIRGIPMNGDIYLQRIPISEVPTDSDQQIAEFLYKLYEEKVCPKTPSD